MTHWSWSYSLPFTKGEGWGGGLSPAPQNWSGGALLLTLLLCLLSPISAPARPQVLTVIADHLTLSDTLHPQYPALSRLRTHGQTALMSPGLAHGPAPVRTVYATLGAGDSIAPTDKSQGLLSRTLAQSHIKSALVGTADSDETGPDNPAALLLPNDVSKDDGTQPDPLTPGGRRTDPKRLWNLTQSALVTNDFVVVYDGDFARAERARETMLPAAYAQARARALQSLDTVLARALSYTDSHPQCTLLFVVPTGPLHNNSWDSLTPFFCYTHAPPQSPVLQSATTQTWGLVAARDFAPTVLALLDVPTPVPMTGAPAAPAAPLISVTDTQTRLAHLDTLTQLNQEAQSPFFWTVGILGGLTLLAGLGAVFANTGSRSSALRPFARAAVRALSALPLALLLAPLASPQTLLALYGAIALLIILIALLPSPSVILSVTAIVLIADGLTGTTLVSESLLSVYALSGIRFYGIGNEYMGVLLAGTLTLAGGAFFASRRRWLVSLLFAVVIVVLSFPSFGAKAGGAVTATAIFCVAWRGLHGKWVGARHVLFGLAVGFAVVLLWGVIGHWLPLRQTHIGTATDALGHARFGYIGGVALRKVGLAVRIILHPGTLAGLLGLGLAAGLASRVPPGRLAEFYARAPRFPALWKAALWGALVCVLFNDSGIVAAILLLTSLALVGLDGLLLLKKP